MKPEQRKILAQISDSKARDSWLATSLPSSLYESAARRLGIVGLVTAALFLTFTLSHVPAGIASDEKQVALVAMICSAYAILLSLAIYLLCRRFGNRPRLLLNVAVPYQITMALVIGITDSLQPLADTSYVRGWSGIAVWIFIFAVFVPNTPIRTLWVSSITALMDPLALLIGTRLGPAPPAAAVLPQLFAPTAAAVITAVIASRINYTVGKKLHDARQMGSYRLLALLGKGGMGEVWRAEHDLLARPAAIKLIQPDKLVKGEGAAKTLLRFEREAQATALLASEHTVELYDFGIATDGSLYYVMELLEGYDLSELVKKHGPMPPERVVHCLLQVCDSLAEAHDKGIIHRDIKPSNIFACRKGLKHDFIKVLDFGLVRPIDARVSEQQLTADQAISGTPAFMVPEVIEASDQIDGRADLYALGCVAYWLLSGKLVFRGSTPVITVLKHLNDAPPRLSKRAAQPIPLALEQLVHACLEKDPNKRPQSASELAQRLAELQLERRWTQQDAEQWWVAHKPPAEADIDPFDNTEEASETPLLTPLSVLSVSLSGPTLRSQDTRRERLPRR